MKMIVEIQKILDSFKEIRDNQDFPHEAMEQAALQKDEITPVSACAIPGKAGVPKTDTAADACQ
jgi:hypothetical protein